MSGHGTSFFESKTWKNIMKYTYGLGAAVVIMGALFKIMHWPGASLMLIIGLSTEAVIFIMSVLEPVHLDADWSRVFPELADTEGEGTEDLAQVGLYDLIKAGSDEPGLFISERCESLWATLPYCISDERNPEDMEKSAPDHSADAVRYVLTAANQGQHMYRPVPPSRMMEIY